ncbi:UNVERIFIED_ORG: EamA family transporter (plasmid) [Roseateles sp. XES5]|nr:EamA family transporter [Roseateles sp. XES5]
MSSVQAAAFGRAMIVLAVLLQAIGKVMYGTWLGSLPTPFFVLVSFALTAAFFLALSWRGAGARAFGPLLLLNAATALTFLSFFYALKRIEPAIVGAVEIGIGPILAILIARLTKGEHPSAARLVVCIGILAGCAILAAAALHGSGFASFGKTAWLGLAASVAAGIGAVLITVASKTLLERGWKFGAVLAHRFYLILPLSLAMTFGTDVAAIEWSGPLVAALLAVSLVGVLAPLYLLQIGIGRCDPYTVMVTMAALPVLTFLIEGLSPLYSWSWLTAAGLAVVTAFLLLDVAAKRR